MLDDIKKTLWATADKQRANMDAAEYKHIVLGLIFLKYISDTFAARRAELTRRFADEGDEYFLDGCDEELLADELEDRDYYREVNVFWVPETARWESLRSAAKQTDIGKRIDEALAEIEAENSKLKGILDKRYARSQLPDGKLGELVDLISTIGFGEDASHARDVLGQVYEYFLGQFASAEGKKGGQFYTPASIVKTLVAVLAPHHGKVYDPCCGSGGMFVQSEKFIEAHGGKLGDVSIYGQESNPTTWRLAAMNLAIRGIDYNLGREPADTFVRNQHPDLRADFVLANPPFNVSDWWHGSLEGDARWVYGTPPQGNANYAWLQHMLYHLKSNGRAGIVLANGSMSSSQNSEGDIRRAMVDADVVEVMVALPGQLFFNTQIPACLWFLAKQKTARQGEILFIDARKLGSMISRVQAELADDAIARIANTVAAWRGEATDGIGEFMDIPGYCRSVKLAEIAEHGHVLTPGRYVGAEEVEDDEEAFVEKMQKLIEKLGEQMAKGAELDQSIRQKLGGLDMSFELTNLGAFATVQGGFAYKSGDFQSSGSWPVLKIKNVRAGYIDYRDVCFVSDEIARVTNKWRTHAGDILISMTGSGPSAPESLVGRVGRVWKGESPALINQRVGRLCLKDGAKIELAFLYHLLSFRDSQNYLVANSTGSANQVNISAKTIEAVPCPNIDFETSKEISSFLDAFDVRTKLLRETNATLEAIAQALFKSWFVDFEPVRAKQEGRASAGMDEATNALFPDGFEESELGLVPRGWTLATLGQLGDFQKGCSYKGEGLSDNNGAYMFNLGCFNAPRIFAFEKIKRYTGDYKPRHSVAVGDLIIANTDMTQDRDILGRPLIVPGGFAPSFVSHHVFKVVLKAPSLRNYLFFCFKTSGFRERAVGYATGTTVLALPKDAIEEHPLVVPNSKLIDVFNEVVGPILELIENNQRTVETLGSLRDTLLPRLISGQLRLSEAETLVA